MAGETDSFDLSNSCLVGEGLIVPVEEAEDELSPDSLWGRSSMSSSSSSSSRSSKIGGGSGGSLARCALANDLWRSLIMQRFRSQETMWRELTRFSVRCRTVCC